MESPIDGTFTVIWARFGDVVDMARRRMVIGRVVFVVVVVVIERNG
jgi:hypothetical protein